MDSSKRTVKLRHLNFGPHPFSNKTAMNKEDKLIGKLMEVVNFLYEEQVDKCIMALRQLGSADLSDKNALIRTIMGHNPDSELSVEDCAVDYWVDRAEYVDESSFNLYVTKAEQNILFNKEKNVRKPRRIEGTQQKLIIHREGLLQPMTIPANYLAILKIKLMAMAFPDKQTSNVIDKYFNEYDIIEFDLLFD